ncbi:Thymidylate kinase [uncultured Desulfatiglans sp.]|nr:Thymidylate kinase [uncultured Desulfatiglans sp.]
MFITFEGIEGCGKSTQAKRLARRLEERNVPTLFTIEPGGTRIGSDIRRILLDARNRDLSPLAELFLYEADRAQHVFEVIDPAREAGRWIVCDRFYDATTVYQGYARGQDPLFVASLNRTAARGLTPDITFLLDCPVGAALARARQREAEGNPAGLSGQDRFEKESEAFHQSVREGYLALARSEGLGGRFRVLDGMLSIERLENEIWSMILPLLPALPDKEPCLFPTS